LKDACDVYKQQVTVISSSSTSSTCIDLHVSEQLMSIKNRISTAKVARPKQQKNMKIKIKSFVKLKLKLIFERRISVFLMLIP